MFVIAFWIMAAQQQSKVFERTLPLTGLQIATADVLRSGLSHMLSFVPVFAVVGAIGDRAASQMDWPGLGILSLCISATVFLGACWRWLLLASGDFQSPKRHLATLAELVTIGVAASYASGLTLLVLVVTLGLALAIGYVRIWTTLDFSSPNPAKLAPTASPLLFSWPMARVVLDRLLLTVLLLILSMVYWVLVAVMAIMWFGIQGRSVGGLRRQLHLPVRPGTQLLRSQIPAL